MRKAILTVVVFAVVACTEQNEPKTNPGHANSASLVTVPADVERAREVQCMSIEALSAYSQVFVDKVDWELLPQTRTWSALAKERSRVKKERGAKDGSIRAFYFSKNSDHVSGSLGWHEYLPVCVEQRGGEFWARIHAPAQERLPEVKGDWEGPFIAVTGATDPGTAYFNRIFGQVCHESEERQSWCFTDGALQIDNKRYRAELMLDTVEMPNYGSPVELEGQEKGFLVFVPFGDGWNVYKDDWVTNDGHVEIDPRRDPPWRRITPKPTR